MSCALRVSEAASIAMHAMGLLAVEPARPVTTKEIAGCFGISEAHLSKVLQRLVKVGLLSSVRGPRGGFVLAGDPRKTTLLAVFEAIEGRLEKSECLFAVPLCDGLSCILGRVMGDANRMLLEHLSATSLKQISEVFLDGRIEIPFDRPASAPPRKA